VSSLEEQMLRAAVPEEERQDLARLLYGIARERGDHMPTAEAFRAAADALTMGDPELGRMIRRMRPRRRHELGEAMAARGLPVFPLRPRGKEPLGALVANGLKNASTDKQTIDDWGLSSRRRMSAYAQEMRSTSSTSTGPDGTSELARLVGEHGDIALEGPTAATGNGYHLLVLPTGRGNRARFIRRLRLARPRRLHRGATEHPSIGSALLLAGRRQRHAYETRASLSAADSRGDDALPSGSVP
jgi:hypothetical protein